MHTQLSVSHVACGVSAHCTADQLTLALNLQAMQAKQFKEGPITVDNLEHPEFTAVTILVALEVEGALLKVASALTNSGCSIQEGYVEVGLMLPCCNDAVHH